MVDHQKNKFFINNSVQAVVLFKEEHQDLLNLPVPVEVGWGLHCGKKQGFSPKDGIFFEAEKITYEEAFHNL